MTRSGTAYASSCRLWFTIWNGIVTEVYYPTVDRPQIRDLQFLVTDGEKFFHEEKRHLRSVTERISHHVLGYRITNSDPGGNYSIAKEVLSDPHLPCLLVNTTLTGEPDLASSAGYRRSPPFRIFLAVALTALGYLALTGNAAAGVC